MSGKTVYRYWMEDVWKGSDFLAFTLFSWSLSKFSCLKGWFRTVDIRLVISCDNRFVRRLLRINMIQEFYYIGSVMLAMSRMEPPHNRQVWCHRLCRWFNARIVRGLAVDAIIAQWHPIPECSVAAFRVHLYPCYRFPMRTRAWTMQSPVPESMR